MPPSIRSIVALLLVVSCIGLAPHADGQEVGFPGAPESAPAEAPAEGATEREIGAELDVAQDRRIAERLRATFASVEALRGIRVPVNAGVVQLTGEVPSAAARELAGQLARQVEDVALVENEIRLVQDVGRRLETAWDSLRQRLFGLIGLLPLLAVAAVVLVLFWYAGRGAAGAGLYRGPTPSAPRPDPICSIRRRHASSSRRPCGVPAVRESAPAR